MRIRPFPLDYALARLYLETYRAEGRTRRRTNAALEAKGKLAAVAELASTVGLVTPGSLRFHVLARFTLEAFPVDAGPEWLERASEHLAASLERIQP